MTYSQVNSSSGHEGELNGALFAGDHTPAGVFSSLKGSALTPPELSFSDQGGNANDGRVQSQAAVIGAGTGWKEHGPVESGTFDPQQTVSGTDKYMPR